VTVDAPSIPAGDVVHKAKLTLPRALMWVVLIAFALLFLLPALWWVSLALRHTASIPVNVSLWEAWVPASFHFFENVAEAFRLYPMGRFFINSIIVATAVTLGEVLFASMAGFALAKYRFIGHRVVFATVMVFLLVPQIVTVIPLFDLAASFGLVNSFPALIVPFLVTPLGIFLMRQLMEDIPDELLEAARVDGANELWIYRRVVLPLARNGLITLAVFSFLFQWDALLWPLVILSRNEMYTLNLGVSLLQTNVQTPYNAIFAVTLMFSLPVMILYFILQRRVVESLTADAVKG
jgi:multiple sugar transport system permease protein